MSRIGKKSVEVPSGVTVAIDGQNVSAKGPKGELQITLVEQVLAQMGDDGVSVQPRDKSKESRSAWGMSRTLVSNIVEGVSKGFERKLEISGVGYRAAVQGKTLQLSLGYSHDVNFEIPADVQIACPKPTEIIVTGIDKQRVGQVAANIRKWREPEPYKGKGIRYSDEYVVRKEGKKK
ncbi:MAG: 50S ribosomal protein L6 [Rhodobiaceae bacterium]|nr:50S ribosomal protein L6 [Rhodobiaceae bacterium]MCC0051587.1 50S ribosomal protein L6 [Rhodobiaceae bacterium]MCC0061457.1 50S ribosomal protein L6 [Rhodobiaceae bacterium]